MNAASSRPSLLKRPDGRDIAFTIYGDRPTAAILLHGWACHQAVWRHQTGPLSRYASVVTLDLAGHGASSPPHRGTAVSIAALARDVVAVADALALDDVVLVGHSMGGPVALEAAILMAGRCRLLLGIETFTDAAFYARRPRLDIIARRGPFESDFPGAMTAMVHAITRAGGPEVVAWIAAEMSRADPATMLAALEALLAWDIEARWPSLPCPAETINSAELSRGISTVPGLSGLRVHLMDHVGHFPMLEDPEVLAARVLDIIRRL